MKGKIDLTKLWIKKAENDLIVFTLKIARGELTIIKKGFHTCFFSIVHHIQGRV
jgi:hypothetical protein